MLLGRHSLGHRTPSPPWGIIPLFWLPSESFEYTWSLRMWSTLSCGLAAAVSTEMRKASGVPRCWSSSQSPMDKVWDFWFGEQHSHTLFCSVTKSCLILCDPMDRTMPGFPVLRYLLEFAQTHVHRVGDPIQTSHPVTPFSSCPQSFPASGVFSNELTFCIWWPEYSESVLPMNMQGWFPLGLPGLIFLLSKGFSRVFSSTTVWMHYGTKLFSWWKESKVMVQIRLGGTESGGDWDRTPRQGGGQRNENISTMCGCGSTSLIREKRCDTLDSLHVAPLIHPTDTYVDTSIFLISCL